MPAPGARVPDPGSRMSGRALVMPRAVQDQVIAHCRREFPKEACGYLVGAADGAVDASYPMTNTEASPIGYAMDPKEQLAVEKRMRNHRERLVGIYHSHTASEAYPSSVDVGLAVSPDVSYVVVSLRDRDRPEIRSYRIDGTTVRPEPVRLEA